MSRNTKADRIRAERAQLVERRAHEIEEHERILAGIDAEIRAIDKILPMFERVKKPDKQAAE